MAAISRFFWQGFLVFWGVLLFDIAAMWLLGAWSYTDWAYQLIPVVLLLYRGAGYIIVPTLRQGNIYDSMYLLITIVTIEWFMRVWVPLDPVMSLAMEEDLPFLLGGLMLLNLGLSIVKGLKFPLPDSAMGEDNPEKSIFWWDFSQPFDKIFSRPINILCWVLAVLSSMVSFYGYSLLTVWGWN